MIVKLMQVSASVLVTGVVSGCPGGSKWGVEEQHSDSGSGESGIASENVRVLAADVPVNTAMEIRVANRNGYLVHVAEDEWVALDRECTHRSCPVNFNESAVEFHCSCHGSKFTVHGEVIKPPAKKKLKQWELRVDGEYVEILAPEATGA